MAMTTEGMDADEVGTVPGAVPWWRPSSHWVVTGTSASADAYHAPGSLSRSTRVLVLVAMS